MKTALVLVNCIANGPRKEVFNISLVLYLRSHGVFYSDLRTLVVDMVLATDMSSHFEQLRAMKAALSVLGR